MGMKNNQDINLAYFGFQNDIPSRDEAIVKEVIASY